MRIVETVVGVNEGRKRRMVKKIIESMGGSVAGRTIAVLGVTFKPNTDDMRESPSLVILPALKAEGATIRAFDPEGMNEARKLLPEVVWCDDAYDAVEGADALVILTEWNVFRGLDLDRARELMRGEDAIAVRVRPVPERGQSREHAGEALRRLYAVEHLVRGRAGGRAGAVEGPRFHGQGIGAGLGQGHDQRGQDGGKEQHQRAERDGADRATQRRHGGVASGPG